MLTLLLSGCANINWWGETDSVKISKGDTLYSISRQYGVPLKQLININNLKAPYTLKIGQRLQLPIKQYHQVKKGDTLYSISRQYDVDITDENINFNPSFDNKLLTLTLVVNISPFVSSVFVVTNPNLEKTKLTINFVPILEIKKQTVLANLVKKDKEKFKEEFLEYWRENNG